MSNFLLASIGRKFMMSITGLFLLVFITVHLALNLLLIIDDSGELFNLGAHFMATNPLIKIMEPILGLGFIVHIIWSVIITYQNWRARPVKYDKQNLGASSTWASRNMFILGGMVFAFLVLHVINFFYVMKFAPHSMETVVIDGTTMENGYKLVSELFINNMLFGIVYILAAVLLTLHLTHGFWSAFQTLGLNNKNWMSRLKLVAKIFAIAIGVGFSIIPLYFMLGFNN
ncbi:MAG: succinate dehydrogenase cytochrome b subunit [Draconibacterium sp.]|nr:succinate dehydrogenase cytochrome b subunit [Draconibacterium sp.]